MKCNNNIPITADTSECNDMPLPVTFISTHAVADLSLTKEVKELSRFPVSQAPVKSVRPGRMQEITCRQVGRP